MGSSWAKALKVRAIATGKSHNLGVGKFILIAFFDAASEV
jgi:hypothetical protein